MENDPGGLGELAEEECLDLLASHEVGRVGVVVDDQPLVFPVNYALEGRWIVVRTGMGMLLHGAAFAHVAFEIDHFDTVRRSGWSVMVQGMAHDITDAVDRTSERLQTVDVLPWAPGSKPRLLRIDPRIITGRRFGAAAGDES